MSSSLTNQDKNLTPEDMQIILDMYQSLEAEMTDIELSLNKLGTDIGQHADKLQVGQVLQKIIKLEE